MSKYFPGTFCTVTKYRDCSYFTMSIPDIINALIVADDDKFVKLTTIEFGTTNEVINLAPDEIIVSISLFFTFFGSFHEIDPCSCSWTQPDRLEGTQNTSFN